jgi:hypothetical protein
MSKGWKLEELSNKRRRTDSSAVAGEGTRDGGEGGELVRSRLGVSASKLGHES